MQKKCPVCDYVLTAEKVEVKVGEKTVVVCCKECAEEVRKKPQAYVGAR